MLLRVPALLLLLLLPACATETTAPSDTAASDATGPTDAATAGESPATPAAADDGAGGTLTVYSGRSEELVGPLFDRFTEETGITVDVKYGDSAELALLLAEEGERTPADVFYSQSPGATGFLAERQLLATIPDDALGQVDAEFRSNDGRWIGITGRQRVLVYNTETLAEDELPQSVFDLTDERYSGQVGVAPQNGSFQDFVSVMRQREGDERTREWLEGIAANQPTVYANNSAIVEAVSRGETAMGLVNHYYNLRFLDENPDLPSRNWVFPDGDIGSLVIPSTVSVVEGSDGGDLAARLIEFLLSEDAQRYFADETFEYPLAPGVEPAGDLPPLHELDVPEVDLDQLGGDLEATVEMIREAGLESAG